MAIEFRYVITAGTVLILERVESQNYNAGVAGWAIFADGNAEFNNVTIRGSLITGPPGSEHIEIHDSPANEIQFYTGDAQEEEHGRLFVDFLTTGVDHALLFMHPPKVDPALNTASLSLDNYVDGYNNAQLVADDIDFFTDLEQFRFAEYITTGEVVQTMTLLGTWATLGAGWPHPRIYKDAMGFVHCVGGVTGGLVGQTIFQLPVGYRPPYLIPVEAEGNLARARITLNTGGNVVLNVGSGTNLLWNCVFPVSGGPMP